MLPRLTRLTHLTTAGFSTENLAQISHLTKLRVLSLTAAVDVTIGLSAAPGLVFPASLTKLVLKSPMEATTLSLLPAQLKVLEVFEEVQGPEEGPGSLLSYMTGLQQLQQVHLWLEDWPPAGPAYSVLTASSSLRSLGLWHATLPEGIWSHVFPAIQKLLHLTCLTLDHTQVGHDDEDLEDFPSTWDAADLCSLVSCCPNLCKIEAMHLQHGSAVAELCKLTALTFLNVYFDMGTYVAADESVKGLADFTQLKALYVTMDSQCLEVSSLLPLTRLTALLRLEFSCPNKQQDPDFLDVEVKQVSQLIDF